MLYWLLYQKLFLGYAKEVPVPGVLSPLPLRHVPNCVREPDGAVSLHRARPVADPQACASFRSGSTSAKKVRDPHQKKAGTPTMGGVLIIISIVVPTLLWADLRNPYVWIAMFGLVGFGAIGFYDDYTKVRKKHNLGLTARQKFGTAGRRLSR